MRLRRLAVTVAAVAALALPVAAATSAQANGTGNQWCYEHGGQACLNAWGGGPRVNVETSQGLQNNDFTLQWDSHASAWQLKDTGGGLYSGQCIGDYGNDPGNASTGLVTCGNGNGGEGWGTLFNATSPCGAGEYVFQNRHWTTSSYTAYLGPPQNYGNGDHFYLNTGSLACLYFTAPA
jgi:hypothetical protein